MSETPIWVIIWAIGWILTGLAGLVISVYNYHKNVDIDGNIYPDWSAPGLLVILGMAWFLIVPVFIIDKSIRLTQSLIIKHKYGVKKKRITTVDGHQLEVIEE